MVNRTALIFLSVLTLVAVSGIAGAGVAADDWGDGPGSAETVTVPGDELVTVNGVLDPGTESDWLQVPVDRGDVLAVTLEKDRLDDVRLHLRFWNAYHVDRPAWRKLDIENRSAGTITATVASAAEGNVTIQVHSRTSRANDWRLRLDRRPGADRYPVPVVVEPGTYTGSIDGHRDRDELRLRADEDDVIRVTLEKAAGSPVRLEFPRGCCGGAIERDTTRIVRRLLVGGEGTPRNVSVPVTGHAGPNSNWTLILERFRDADRWPSEPREVYPGTSHRGAIDASEDRDALEIPMLAGDTLTVTLRKGVGEYVQMHVRGPDGRLALDFDNTSARTASVTINATETGFVTVDLWGHVEGADANEWELTLSGNRSTEYWIDRRGPSNAPSAAPTSQPPPPTAGTTATVRSTAPGTASSTGAVTTHTEPSPGAGMGDLGPIGVGVLAGAVVTLAVVRVWRNR